MSDLALQAINSFCQQIPGATETLCDSTGATVTAVALGAIATLAVAKGVQSAVAQCLKGRVQAPTPQRVEETVKKDPREVKGVVSATTADPRPDADSTASARTEKAAHKTLVGETVVASVRERETADISNTRVATGTKNELNPQDQARIMLITTALGKAEGERTPKDESVLRLANAINDLYTKIVIEEKIKKPVDEDCIKFGSHLDSSGSPSEAINDKTKGFGLVADILIKHPHLTLAINALFTRECAVDTKVAV